MTKLSQKKFIVPVIGVILITIGLLFAIRSGRKALESYRAMRFAMEHDFDAGNLDVELIQPWMSIRYIAEAYAVPQSFIFDEINLDMNRSNSRLPLGQLNQLHDFGKNELGEPALVDLIVSTVELYRQQPVATGLSEGRVEPWMNVTYIANSTGVPVETFFADLGIPAEGYAYMPLKRLVDEAHYKPGVEKLMESLEQTIDTNGGRR